MSDIVYLLCVWHRESVHIPGCSECGDRVCMCVCVGLCAGEAEKSRSQATNNPKAMLKVRNLFGDKEEPPKGF